MYLRIHVGLVCDRSPCPALHLPVPESNFLYRTGTNTARRQNSADLAMALQVRTDRIQLGNDSPLTAPARQRDCFCGLKQRPHRLKHGIVVTMLIYHRTHEMPLNMRF